jgi:uncharacterized membrane protein YhiD involved in acid resistance
MGEWVKTIGSFASAAMAIIAFTALIIKPIRNRLVQWIKSKAQTTEYNEKLNDVAEQVTEIARVLNEHVTVDRAFNAEMQEAINQLRCGNMYSLGDIIRSIYHRNQKAKEISEREYKLVDDIYKLYHDTWHGNGIIQNIVDEIQDCWTIIH